MTTKDILTSEEYYLTIGRLVAAGIIETPPSMYDLMACLSNDPDMAGDAGPRVTPNLDERREGRGFTYHCANGYEVSVQWGEGCYSDVRHKQGPCDSPNAEVAVINPTGAMVMLQKFDQVLGWQSPQQVLAVINKAETCPDWPSKWPTFDDEE